MARIAFIAAMDDDNCIGVGNDLPFRISADLKRFKALTSGKPMIMGRKTFDSLGGKPLPNRLHIVVSRTKQEGAENVVYVTSLDEGIALAQKQNAQEIMVIGGGQIFAAALDRADRLYMTHVAVKTPRCDAHFPPIDSALWRLAESEGPHKDEKSGLSYSYKTYDRL